MLEAIENEVSVLSLFSSVVFFHVFLLGWRMLEAIPCGHGLGLGHSLLPRRNSNVGRHNSAEVLPKPSMLTVAGLALERGQARSD